MKKFTFASMLLVFILINFLGCSEEEVLLTENPPANEKVLPDEQPFQGGDYYVATDGSDLNPGTYEEPWATWEKAFRTAKAGDTVYFRGGVYYDTDGVTLRPKDGDGNNGTPDNRICFFNYPGEKPILDGSRRIETAWNTALSIDYAHFIHLKGLTIRNYFQNGNPVEGAGINCYGSTNIIFENLDIHNTLGSGIKYTGYDEIPDWPGYDTTRVLNCDFYDNIDSISSYPGGKADGLIMYGQDTSLVYIIEGCRAWNNSDDGFDVSSQGLTIINSCWSFENGRLQGDGIGFKYGHKNTRTDVSKIIFNCFAGWNSVAGFNENIGHVNKIVENLYVYNCVSYQNFMGFVSVSIPDPVNPGDNIYKNNISYDNSFKDVVHSTPTIHDHNSWDSDVTVTDEDFISLNPAELKAPRKDDGSLPDINFMKLAANSDLKNAGTSVGAKNNKSTIENPDIGINWDSFGKKYSH